MAQRATVVAITMLTLIGLWLIFGGSDSPEPASEVVVNVDRSVEPAHPTTAATEPTPPPEASPSPSPSSGGPTEPHDTHSDSPSGDPHGNETDPEGHRHEWPTEEEIAAAPRPDFEGPFPTDVPPELATQLADLAWTWLKPILEEKQWTHLERLQYGVTTDAKDDRGRAVDATVAIGYTGVDGIGSVSAGRAANVSTSKVNGVWKITGMTEWAPPPD